MPQANPARSKHTVTKVRIFSEDLRSCSLKKFFNAGTINTALE